MKQTVLLTILLSVISLTSCKTQRVVQGPQGKIATTLRMPHGVDGNTDSIDVVLLMHGIFSSKSYAPIPKIAEFIRCFGIFKLGRDYLTQTQQLDIYGTAANYQGPVCLIHGTKDRIVSVRCSKKYDEIYKNSQLHLVEGETHTMRKKIGETIEIINRFLETGYGMDMMSDTQRLVFETMSER